MPQVSFSPNELLAVIEDTEIISLRPDELVAHDLFFSLDEDGYDLILSLRRNSSGEDVSFTQISLHQGENVIQSYAVDTDEPNVCRLPLKEIFGFLDQATSVVVEMPLRVVLDPLFFLGNLRDQDRDELADLALHEHDIECSLDTREAPIECYALRFTKGGELLSPTSITALFTDEKGGVNFTREDTGVWIVATSESEGLLKCSEVVMTFPD